MAPPRPEAHETLAVNAKGPRGNTPRPFRNHVLLNAGHTASIVAQSSPVPPHTEQNNLLCYTMRYYYGT